MLLHAVELAPDGVLIVDNEGIIVYANAAMHQLSGHDSLAGRAVEELVPDALRSRHTGLRSGYQAEPAQRPMGAGLELVMKRADGWELPVEISLSPFEHGGRFTITAVRDVSDRLEAQRRLTAAHEQLALLSERERIGRDLHDVVLQHLYGMGLTVQAISAATSDDVKERLDLVVEDVDRIISEVRTIVFTLGPAGERGALGQELADVVAQASRVLGFTPGLRLEGPVDSVLSAEIRTEMIASMREALGNVARRADATEAQVLVAVDQGAVVMTVIDDGVGLPADESELQGGHGLHNLQQRASNFGGACSLSSRADRSGAVLRWTVPF
jgi:PAS domain S-box-containing protein